MAAQNEEEAEDEILAPYDRRKDNSKNLLVFWSVCFAVCQCRNERLHKNGRDATDGQYTTKAVEVNPCLAAVAWRLCRGRLGGPGAQVRQQGRHGHVGVCVSRLIDGISRVDLRTKRGGHTPGSLEGKSARR